MRIGSPPLDLYRETRASAIGGHVKDGIHARVGPVGSRLVLDS